MQRRSTRWLGVTTAALAVMAVVSGCGTNDSDDSSSKESRSVAGLPASATPTTFRVDLSCFCELSAHIEWSNERLVYVVRNRGIRLNPPRTHWKRFWRRANELNVWDWEKRYELDHDVTDQVDWSVDLEHGGKEIHTSGYGEFPAEFGEFQEALSSLVGDRPVLQDE